MRHAHRLCAAGLALVAAGPQAFSRLALRLGWDGGAARFIDDPAARGALDRHFRLADTLNTSSHIAVILCKGDD